MKNAFLNAVLKRFPRKFTVASFPRVTLCTYLTLEKKTRKTVVILYHYESIAKVEIGTAPSNLSKLFGDGYIFVAGRYGVLSVVL